METLAESGQQQAVEDPLVTGVEGIGRQGPLTEATFVALPKCSGRGYL